MEEVLNINDVQLHGTAYDMKMAPPGIALRNKSNGELFKILGTDIMTAKIFYGHSALSLRISLEGATHCLENIKEDFMIAITDIFAKHYNINVENVALDIVNTTTATLCTATEKNGEKKIEFRNENLVFEIPQSAIDETHEINNEITFLLKKKSGVVEMTFYNNTGLVETMAETEEARIVENVQVLQPRMRSNFIFYNEFVKIVGPTYSHRIRYNDILELYRLTRENGAYFVMKINPIRQGNTKYDFIVMNLTEDGLIDLIEKATNLRVDNCDLRVKCTHKACDGVLFLLEKAVFFLPKPIFISHREIEVSEFSRINTSRLTSSSFDMRLIARGAFNFDYINKNEFNKLEVYLTEKGIKIRSEIVVDNSESATEESEESCYEDSIEASDDE